MKKTLLALAAVAAIAAVPAFAATAADTPGAPTGGKIAVNGTGIVESAPDTVEWSFGATAEADSAAAALSRVNSAGNRIVAAVRAAGIASNDVRTEQVSISPQFDENGRVSDRFLASKSVHVVVRNLSLAGKVVDAAVGAGASNVSGPMFSQAEREQLYRTALKAAVDSARANAQALADASGVMLGRVLEVQDAGAAQPLPAMEAAKAGAADSMATEIDPGRSSTYASVTVIFETT